MKKNIYAIIDTETANGLYKPLVYDVSIIIFDRMGNEYFRKNWLISEVWDNKSLMNTAYYAWKMPLYKDFDVTLLDMFSFIEEFCGICSNYNVTHILAYNLPFDIRALHTTSKKYNQSEFIDENIIRQDVWGMACELLLNCKKYKDFCKENGFISEKGNYKTSAECAYRFITDNKEFEESHTSLSDCEIEKEIFMACLRKHKKYTVGIIYNPWRLIQDKE